MQHIEQVFVGVDVSKSTLSSHTYGSKERRDFANEEATISTWLASLPANACIAVEATGRYHQLLIRLAHASGRRAFVLNAGDVFFYAKSLGVRGKTDRKDARVIATNLAQHHDELRVWAPTASRQERIEDLLRCRAGVARKRSSLKQLLSDTQGLEVCVGALEGQFEALLTHIDVQITALVDEDPVFSARCRQLRTIAGVGPQVSVRLASLFSRFEFANSDAAVAFTGLDPRPRDSGTMIGRRRISKRGDPELRRLLYLMAFAATRSKAIGPVYKAIKARGFKPTQALVILARKLMRVALAIWRSGKDFDPTQLGPRNTCAQP